MEALCVLALTTGARWGELLGLKWPDIDLDGGVLWIARSLGRVRGQGLVDLTTKAPRSRRQITLTPEAVGALKRGR